MTTCRALARLETLQGKVPAAEELSQDGAWIGIALLGSV